MSPLQLAPSPEVRDYDETKHVNYVLGMLLGVDDFEQEFAYLAGRDRRLARDAVGFGTVSGLHVKIEPDPQLGPSNTARRIAVSCGSAITPRGFLVSVRPSQCAWINEWLAANQEALEKRHRFVAPGVLPLYVVLGYDSCKSDSRAIPGDPCRSESKLTINARVTDSFRLELSTDPPEQDEEDAVVAFVEWLRSVPAGGGPPYASASDLEEAIQSSIRTEPAIASPLESPPASPLGSPLMKQPKIWFASPPPSLVLDPADLPAYVRAALRVWVTQIRPEVHACSLGSTGCCQDANEPENDDLVLLARIDVPLKASDSGEWIVDEGRSGELRIDESRRPIVVHNRLLQELSRFPRSEP